MAKNFPGMSENQVKNRFYSTLRRVATKKADNKGVKIGKEYLIQFLEDAILYGHNCRSKRGRKPKNVRCTGESKQNDSCLPITEEQELENPYNDVHGRNYLFEEEKECTYKIGFNVNSYKDDNDEEEYNKLAAEEGYPNFLFVDPDHIRLLVHQNEKALEAIEEKSQYQINDTQDLLELLKETKDKLIEMERIIREIAGNWMV